MAKNEIGIYLTQQGFFAGKRMENGTLQLGAHKISEDEIFAMFGALMRTWQRKTGKDTMMLPGSDGSVVVAKLVRIEDQAPQTEEPAAGAVPKRKRTGKSPDDKARTKAKAKSKAKAEKAG